MIRLCKRYTFEAAHHLPKHEGQCKNNHGHSYKVDVTIQGETIQTTGPASGMLIDFSVLDEAVQPIIKQLDHTDLNDNDYLGVEWPTAEVIAGRIAARLLQSFKQSPDADGLTRPDVAVLHSVRVWETERAYAEWINA